MSRYPVLGRPAGGYDESLLQIAPQITRADRQVRAYLVSRISYSALDTVLITHEYSKATVWIYYSKAPIISTMTQTRHVANQSPRDMNNADSSRDSPSSSLLIDMISPFRRHSRRPTTILLLQPRTSVTYSRSTHTNQGNRGFAPNADF